MEKIDKIGFIGGGNMAEAIIKGLIGGAFPVARLLVAEPSDERRRLLEDRYGVHVISDNRELVRDCDLLVLAVKPQVREAALTGLGRPFHRVDAARGTPGSGLGLASVARVAAVHGGGLVLHNRIGGGLIVELTLASDPRLGAAA